jgi:hypothetical protein
MNEKLQKLYTQWLADGREIIDYPNVREDAGLFSQNAGNIFRYNMMLGMMTWRDGDDPTSLFNEAIDDIIRYRDDLASRGMTTAKLPLSTATILASLLDRQFEFLLGPCELDFAGDLFLDCHLAKRLQGVPPEPDVQKGFDRLDKLKRQTLAARSYKTYFDMLDMVAASADIAGAIEAANANYAARRKDAFYSGGHDIEGGGQDNDAAIDYRLAAIMKCRSVTATSLHGWLW